ncbi:motility associated factor glycosyltransferase family protein [Brevibacillus marinus]|uniref:motility associated factor glycosyltransferase family protein n=1 Tax=Brevibacillus marinus TaxID=2496837 RepID=UPI000F81A12B|nr:6-hydroxymethylpterin diphosphokinase MptE-like protein [Brevibacillus marinus]
MALIDNITFIKSQFPLAARVLQNAGDPHEDKSVIVEQAKNGQYTVAVHVDGFTKYLHSGYNPQFEAERFISQQTWTGTGEKRHVFFYGVGLGYHIAEFIKRYPDVSVSLYEPNMTIFQHFISFVDLRDWKNNLKNIYIEQSEKHVSYYLNHFTKHSSEEISIIVLPSYERVFRDRTAYFVAKFREAVYTKAAYVRASKIFAKRIPINNIINLSKVVRSPDILTDGARYFRGKPVVLVAAGPSLDQEYDNLRYIKENKLAYIFSVGSAVNSLLSQGICPDAACTYDGSEKNATVFQKIKEHGITEIPLFFGTTVGHETLENYPGRLFHFLVSRDTISPFLLRRTDDVQLGMVGSFTTIATITLHLLSKLGCSPIILVGQNLAFTKTQTYAKGIDYINPILEDLPEQNTITVKDVEGNEIRTSRLFNNMRKEMQTLIAMLDSVEIINTTKGGAHIEGTVFIPLQDVIEERLKKNGQVVSHDWLQMEPVQYDFDYLQEQVKKMESLFVQYEQTIAKFDDLFTEMKRYIQNRNYKQLEKCFTKFDKLFNRMHRNEVSKRIIVQMNNLLFEQIMKMFEEVRFSKDVVGKAERVMEEFGTYLDSCRNDTKVIKYLLDEMKQEVLGETVAG